jgi:negative regulator of flagellin synthesis FlgM
MKIEKSSKPLPVSTPVSGPGGAAARVNSGKNANDTAPATGTDVHLGSTAAQLQKMESSMASTPVVDAAKVEQIKQAISQGRFQINSGVVADNLIQSVTDLISAKAGNSQAGNS